MPVIIWIIVLTIVRVTSSDTPDDKKKLREDFTKMKSLLEGIQGNKEVLENSFDEFINGLDDYFKKDDDEEAYNDKLSKANAIVAGTSLAIPKFKSGEPQQIISGVLDMTSMALKTFGGPYGAAGAVVLDIVSNLFGLFVTVPKTGPSLDQVMAEVLDDFQDKQNLKRMNSFVIALVKAHKGIVAARKFSKGIEGKDLTDEDITQLKTGFDVFATDTLLEDVKQGVADKLISRKVPDAEKALQTLNIYCKLTIVVELVMVEIMNYIREEGSINSKMPTIYHTHMNVTRENDKKYLKILHLPEIKQALVAVIYQKNPERFPELRQYIKALEVDPIPTLELKDNGVIYLNPISWPKWYFFLTYKTGSFIYGSTKTNGQSAFKLVKIDSGQAGREWMLENVYYKKHYLTATAYENCRPSAPIGEVAYIQGLTMKYMNDIAKNCETMCRANGHCIGCFRNCYSTFKIGQLRNLVSFNYVWRFTKLKSSDHYFISATQRQFGVGYTLFMKNSYMGNAFLKYGNPGESGVFKLTKNR